MSDEKFPSGILVWVILFRERNQAAPLGRRGEKIKGHFYEEGTLKQIRMTAADVIPQPAHDVAHLAVTALIKRQFDGKLLACAGEILSAAHGIFEVGIAIECQPCAAVVEGFRRGTGVEKLVETTVGGRAKCQRDRAA